MNCPHCGYPLRENESLCWTCGAYVQQAAQPAPQFPQYPQQQQAPWQPQPVQQPYQVPPPAQPSSFDPSTFWDDQSEPVLQQYPQQQSYALARDSSPVTQPAQAIAPPANQPIVQVKVKKDQYCSFYPDHLELNGERIQYEHITNATSSYAESANNGFGSFMGRITIDCLKASSKEMCFQGLHFLFIGNFNSATKRYKTVCYSLHQYAGPILVQRHIKNVRTGFTMQIETGRRICKISSNGITYYSGSKKKLLPKEDFTRCTYTYRGGIIRIYTKDGKSLKLLGVEPITGLMLPDILAGLYQS